MVGSIWLFLFYMLLQHAYTGWLSPAQHFHSLDFCHLTLRLLASKSSFSIYSVFSLLSFWILGVMWIFVFSWERIYVGQASQEKRTMSCGFCKLFVGDILSCLLWKHLTKTLGFYLELSQMNDFIDRFYFPPLPLTAILKTDTRFPAVVRTGGYIVNLI